MIDMVLSKTGQEKIHYVGHSMGTTGFMVMINERPEYADKVKLANLMAPVAYVENMISPIRILAPFVDEIEVSNPTNIKRVFEVLELTLRTYLKQQETKADINFLQWIMELFGLGEFLPNSWFLQLLSDLFCDPSWLQPICSSVLFLLCGFNPDQLNETLLPTITEHTPAGASTKQVIHYAQEVNWAEFQKYDFGKADNQQIYGQETPPLYSVGNVHVPVATYFGENDWLTARAVCITNSYPDWSQLDIASFIF